MPPIHFWPRVMAGVVDYLLATVLVLLLIWPFLRNPDLLRLDVAGFLETKCDTKGQFPALLMDQIGTKPHSDSFICETSVLGRSNGKTATLVYDGLYRDGHPTAARTISVAISDDFNPVTPLMPQALITVLIMILGCGLMICRTGQSPGKRLLCLRVIGNTGLGLQRELIKLLPCVLLAVVALGQTFIDPLSYVSLTAQDVPVVHVASAVILVPLGWYYVLPLIWWRGATRYDRWLGLTVVAA